MSTSVTLNAVSYTIPAQGEGNWGTNVSNYLIALSTGVLQKAGGTFTLTADVDFGATYGLKSVYFKSRNTPSTAGIVRLGNNESVGWRNAANSANLELKVNASNKLEFDGQDIPTIDIGAADTVLQMNAGGTTWEFAKIDNNNVDASAAIAYSKLNLATSIVNADVATAAAIARSKLASGTASYVLINSGAGVMSEEQYLDRTRGGTGITSTATFPSSGTVATTSNKLSAFAATTSSELAGVISDETGSGALVFGTAPTLDKPVVNQIDVTQGASATTPASGKSAVYVNSGDGKIHVVDSSGNDSAVGSGGAGARNYLSDWFDGIKSVGSVTNSITATGNVTISTTAWQASDTSKLTVANVTSAGIRGDAMTNSGAKSLKLDHVAVGAAFVQSPNFQLDLVDAGKPVMVRFDHGAVTTADDFQVMMVRYNSSGTYQEQINIAGTASATSPYSARLAAGSITTFNGFFIAGSTTTDYYALRFYRNNASDTTDIQIDSLYCGPQSVVQGAAVCDPIAFTTTKSAGLGGSTETLWYARSGKMMQLWGSITVGTVAASAATLTLPTGLTIDSAYLDTSGTARLGTFSNLRNASTALYSGGYAGDVYYNGTTSVIALDCNSASRAYPGTSASGIMSTSDVLTISALIPIAEWSSNVTMANRAVESYSSNNSSGTTSDTGTANFAYGARGATLNFTSTPAGTSFKRRIRFDTPRQPTDSLILEVSPDGTYWQPVGGAVVGSGTNLIDALRYDGTNFIGMGLSTEDSTSTDCYVWFGKYRTGTSTAWDATTGGYYYRVRKISGGASVGYPVSTANIVGRTDGTTVGSGYIGEKIGGAVGSPVSLTTNTPANGASLSLTPGVWQIFATCYFDGTGSTTWSDTSFIGITTTSATMPADDTVAVVYPTSGKDHTLKTSTVVNISATTTYYMVVQATFGASTAAVRASYSSFYAIRIA